MQTEKKLDPLTLYNVKTFDLEYFKLLGQGYTNQKAFDTLNEHFRKATGKPRYSSLNSYQVTKGRRLKK